MVRSTENSKETEIENERFREKNRTAHRLFAQAEVSNLLEAKTKITIF